MSSEPERRRRDPAPSHPSVVTRVRRAFGGLQLSQRRVIFAAGLLLASMFLPWYSRNTAASSARGLQTASDATSAISVFTFVEAAIFLVAVGVVVLMLARGERRAFHLPGGDGTIVSLAGLWAAFLVFYRFVDQPDGGTSKSIAYDYGLHWGIFFGLLAALFLAYAGNLLRTAHLLEPPLPGTTAPTTGPPPAVREQEDPEPRPPARPRPSADRAPTLVAPRTPAARRAQENDQLSFEEPGPPEPEPEPPTRRADQLPFEEPEAFEDEPPEFPRR